MDTVRSIFKPFLMNRDVCSTSYRIYMSTYLQDFETLKDKNSVLIIHLKESFEFGPS